MHKIPSPIAVTVTPVSITVATATVVVEIDSVPRRHVWWGEVYPSYWKEITREKEIKTSATSNTTKITKIESGSKIQVVKVCIHSKSMCIHSKKIKIKARPRPIQKIFFIYTMQSSLSNRLLLFHPRFLNNFKVIQLNFEFSGNKKRPFRFR